MIFEIEMTGGEKKQVDTVISYSWSADLSAACDGLRLYFLKNDVSDTAEAYRIRVFDGSDCVFFGYVDTEKTTYDAQGCVCFIYARSSACLLVDNEAAPVTLISPTSTQLFETFAKEFGFKNGLGEIQGDMVYMIPKGTSCFGAIQDFAADVSGAGIYVDSGNTLRLYDNSDEIEIPQDIVISASVITERGEPVSDLNYKIESSESYRHCLTSLFLKQENISRKRYFNASSYPVGQRERVLRQKLYSLSGSYRRLELTVQGTALHPLYSRFTPQSNQPEYFRGYILEQRVIEGSEKGETTKLVFRKDVDLQEVMYVAE